jgi:hypothetical protein
VSREALAATAFFRRLEAQEEVPFLTGASGDSLPQQPLEKAFHWQPKYPREKQWQYPFLGPHHHWKWNKKQKLCISQKKGNK